MMLSSEAQTALKDFYSNYLQDIENGKDSDKALHIDNNLLKLYVEKLGYVKAVDVCDELSMYGFLSYMDADNTIYWAKLEEKAICYMSEQM